MPRYRKNAKHPIIKTGLYSHIEKWAIDKRTRLYRSLEAARQGLLSMFPQEPNPAVLLLVDRMLFKGLKLGIYERMEMQGADTGGPGAEQRYLNMANSLREDIRLLTKLASNQSQEHGPGLMEYLDGLKKAGQGICITPIKVKGGGDD